MPERQAKDTGEGRAKTSPVPMAPSALSPFKIETLQCPHRYRDLYVIGNEPQGAEAVALALGSLAHEVAATYVNHLAKQKSATDIDWLAELAHDAWRDRPHRIPESMFQDYTVFTHTLANYVFDTDLVEAEARIAFNQHWDVVTWHDPDVAFAGMLDVVGVRYQGGAPVSAYAIDWTTAAISGQFAAKKDLQLRFYGLLLARLFDIHDVHITTKSLRTGATREVDLDSADHEQTEARIRDERARLLRLLETEKDFDWPAVPNSQCGICQIPCPEVNFAEQGDVPLRLESLESAQDALRRLTLIDSRRKGIMAALKGYCTFYGAVEAGGMEAAMRPRAAYSYPTSQVMLSLEPDDSAQVLKVDRTVLNRLAKKQPDIFGAVAELAKVKTSDRFGVKAAALDDAEDEE